MRIRFAVLLALLLAASSAACSRKGPAVIVGSQSGVEQQLVSEVIAQHLEKKLGKDAVTRNFALGASEVVHQQTLAGQVDLYPEYSGIALTSILKLSPTSDPAATREQVREFYKFRFQFEWLGPLGFDNRYQMVIRKSVSESERIVSLSGASERAKGWSLGLSADFQASSTGSTLLMKTYQIGMASPVRTASQVELYNGLLRGQFDLISGRVTDPQLQSPEFVGLNDDRQAFVPFECGIAVRSDTLQKFPGLAASLNELAGKFTNETMRTMNAEAGKGRSHAELAAAFLRSVGL